MLSLTERLFERLWRVELLDPAEPGLIIRVAFNTYRGRPVVLSDGTEVRRGDRIVEIHQRNDLVIGYHEPGASAGVVGMRYVKMIRQSLGRVSAAFDDDPRFAGAVAVYGTSLFPEVAVRHGFETRRIEPRLRREVMSWWVRRLTARSHPLGRERVVEHGKPREVKAIWIGRERLAAAFRASWDRSRTREQVGERDGAEPELADS